MKQSNGVKLLLKRKNLSLKKAIELGLVRESKGRYVLTGKGNKALQSGNAYNPNKGGILNIFRGRK